MIFGDPPAVIATIAPLWSGLVTGSFQGEADMGISFRRAVQMPAAVAFALAACGAWTLTAASEPSVLVDEDAITQDEIEQRARFLALGAVDIAERAKEKFQELVESRDLAETMKVLGQGLEREVVTGNPGKTREELIAIFEERMQARKTEIGIALQKEAVESARATLPKEGRWKGPVDEGLLPKLRKHAREELIDERLKLQTARKSGIEVSDAEARALIEPLAARNSMTYEQFSDHLKGLGVDIATMVEKLRAQKAWSELKRQIK